MPSLLPEATEYCCCSSVVEHFLGKEEVVSSILINSSRVMEVVSLPGGRQVLPIVIGTSSTALIY
jgi:hypothetical protein